MDYTKYTTKVRPNWGRIVSWFLVCIALTVTMMSCQAAHAAEGWASSYALTIRSESNILHINNGGINDSFRMCSMQKEIGALSITIY